VTNAPPADHTTTTIRVVLSVARPETTLDVTARAILFARCVPATLKSPKLQLISELSSTVCTAASPEQTTNRTKQTELNKPTNTIKISYDEIIDTQHGSRRSK